MSTIKDCRNCGDKVKKQRSHFILGGIQISDITSPIQGKYWNVGDRNISIQAEPNYLGNY